MRLCGKIKAIRTAYVVGERGASVKKKRCLIVTASIGSGHIKAAEALKKSFAVEDPEMDVSVVDFMTRDIAWKNWFMKYEETCSARFINSRAREFEKQMQRRHI